MQAQGVRRIELFMMIAGVLSRAQDAGCSPAPSYLPDPSGYMSAGINKALAYIRETPDASPSAKPISRRSPANRPAPFRAAFRRHTGMSLVQYVKRLRINLACQILMSDEPASITDICFEVGYNNLSNFNRQFLAEKGMPPSRFRRLAGGQHQRGKSRLGREDREEKQSTDRTDAGAHDAARERRLLVLKSGSQD